MGNGLALHHSDGRSLHKPLVQQRESLVLNFFLFSGILDQDSRQLLQLFVKRQQNGRRSYIEYTVNHRHVFRSCCRIHEIEAYQRVGGIENSEE